MLRYEIGDMAEWAPPCPCGRGLPTLRRITGRKLNLLRLPGGDALIPDIERQDFHAIAPIEDIQVVQHDLARIEIRLAAPALPDAPTRARIVEAVRHGLHGRDFIFEITRFPVLPRGPSGKHALFVCAFDPDAAHENIAGAGEATPP
jgi:phenylacetate-CoA ligase